MKRTLLTASVAAATSLASQHVHADEDPVIVMGEVRVNAARSAGPLVSNRILTSVDVLGADKVEDKNVMNSWELIGQLPGIQLTETRMGAESGKATFRAFNGEGYINGIKVLIDGIPSNVNSGNQRFIDMVFPLEVDYIEVVRGTNDPRYGLHNIGGNINFGTRQGGNYLDGRFTYGSFDTREVQLAMGREANGFAQNYFVAKQDSDEYRGSGSDKYSLGAKWFLSSADNSLRGGLVLRAYRHEAGEPGFLTADELRADRRQSPAKNANDASDRDMQHASAHLDWQINPNTFWSNKLYFNSYDDDRRVSFTSNPAGHAPRQRRLWNEDQIGFLSTLTWRMDDRFTFEAGANTERQDNRYRRYRFTYALPTDFSRPAFTQNDEDYDFNNVGTYVQAIFKPFEALRIVPGFRVDRFTGSNRNGLTGISAGLQDTGWIEQPKLSMVYSPTQNLSVYANWGRTFQVLTGSGAPAYLMPGQTAFQPSINTGKELGVKFKPGARTDVRLAVWRQDATDEVANMPATGTTVGLGETRREGLDLQVSTRLTERLQLWAAHSLQKAEVVKAFSASGESLAGKEVFSTPRHISNAGVEYRASSSWRFGLQGRAQGNYYIDNANSQGKYGGFVLFDANVRYQLSPRTSIDFQVKNLADRKYEYVWYDNFFWPAAQAQASFSPGTGRAAYLSLNVKL
ncbi:TonB-dependent receptor [Massilia sp. IC2-477]|uniref:TonB-dependent receptor n=1 Tax=Massilia sp. IC2-477 TaxID=2887198 RepID=UPI001D0FB911|nr:TonB-dependent receptor [Massilia sp. IC2-477]MCC2957605.1 TonB-dependent receptor [Massilia sp. IC2-477]